MRFVVRLSLGLLMAASCLLGSGCATQLNLTMKKDLAPVDRSLISSKLKEKKITKIIIIPPEGTPRSDLEAKIMLFEREFLKQGIRVISGDITGRVVMEAIDKPNEKKLAVASTLSEMERALTMAGTTGADAILQLIEFRWIFPKAPSRYFIGEPEDKADFREVSYEEWLAWSGPRRDFSAPKWIFTGRAVDVSNGEVLASYDLSMPANFTLPEDYGALYLYTPVENRTTKSKLIAESFHYDGDRWLLRAMERAEIMAVARVAGSMNVKAPEASAGEAPTPPLLPAPPEKLAEVPPEKLAETSPAVAAPQVAAVQETAAPSPLPVAVKKLYAIQIKAFQNNAQAKKFTAEMKKKLPDVQAVRANIKRKGTWYRILVGPFCTKDEALRYREEKGIGNLYPDSFIQKADLPPKNTSSPGRPRKFIGP